MKNMEQQVWSAMDAVRGTLLPEQARNTLVLGLFHQYAELSPQFEVPEEARIESVIIRGYHPNAWWDALQIIAMHNKHIADLEEVLDTLYPAGIDSRVLTKVLVELSHISPTPEEIGLIFRQVNVQMERNVGKGFVTASTPPAINKLGIQILDPEHGSAFYDGSAGIGYTLLAAKQYTDERARLLHLYGEEISKVSWALGQLHLLMYGVREVQLMRADALLQPAFLGTRSFDSIMMDPPYGMRLNEEQYKALLHDPYGRSNFGIPPRSSADMLFVLHALASLSEKGRAVIVLPNGPLFRSAAESSIRKALLQADVVEAVIALPSQLHQATGIPLNLLVLNRSKSQRRKGKVLFINAEEQYTQVDRRTRDMDAQHIDHIVQTFRAGVELDQFSKWVEVRDIQDGNLLASKYLQQSKQHIEGIGMVEVDQEALESAANTRPLQALAKLYRGINILPKELQAKEGGYGILRVSDVKDGELQLNGIETYDITNNAKVDSYLVQEGDVIVSSRGANIKIAVIPPHEGKLLLTQNFIGIRPAQNLDPFFLKAYLESPVGQFLLAGMQVGTTITTISPKNLGELPVPKLDLESQRQIRRSVQGAEEQYRQVVREAEAQKQEALRQAYQQMGIDEVYTINR